MLPTSAREGEGEREREKERERERERERDVEIYVVYIASYTYSSCSHTLNFQFSPERARDETIIVYRVHCTFMRVPGTV